MRKKLNFVHFLWAQCSQIAPGIAWPYPVPSPTTTPSPHLGLRRPLVLQLLPSPPLQLGRPAALLTRCLQANGQLRQTLLLGSPLGADWLQLLTGPGSLSFSEPDLLLQALKSGEMGRRRGRCGGGGKWVAMFGIGGWDSVCWLHVVS